MPYHINRTIGGFEVVNSQTGVVHAKHTSKVNAVRQVRLLHMVERGRKPTKRRSR